MFNDIIDRASGKKKLVFLGGTNNSTWRDQIIPKLEIDYFNPIVKDWTPDCKQKEIEVRSYADYLLYVITPAMTGVYSIAELVDDSNKRPNKTIFCYLDTDNINGNVLKFTEHQISSLNSVGQMIQSNGAKWLKNLDEVVNYLNNT
jgi:hypothetical protein